MTATPLFPVEGEIRTTSRIPASLAVRAERHCRRAQTIDTLQKFTLRGLDLLGVLRVHAPLRKVGAVSIQGMQHEFDVTDYADYDHLKEVIDSVFELEDMHDEPASVRAIWLLRPADQAMFNYASNLLGKPDFDQLCIDGLTASCILHELPPWQPRIVR